MLTETHISLVKSTIPLLENAGPDLTDYFYKRMFNSNPELKDIFNMSNQHSGRQQLALFEALAAYAKNIENPAALNGAVERIAHKHTSMNILPDHYDIVGHHLLETLRELAPEQFTADIHQAWIKAYTFLAQVFINREDALYTERANSHGGWSGSREFKIEDKVKESELVTSFILSPTDNQPVINFKPGQYIGVEVKPENSEHKEIRQYSLSNKANGKNYRISVKRETNGKPGQVSNHLHDNLAVGDHIKLNNPAGDFFFEDKQRPVALISAGVGITPMMAMLETLSAHNYQQPVHFIHACGNSAQHSFKDRTFELCDKNQWQSHIWYQFESSNEANISEGLIDFSSVDLPLTNGDFYLCGPVAFMQFARNALLKLGVEDTSIHYEVFGPHADL